MLIQGSADSETAAYVGISQIPIFLAPLIMRLFIESGSSEMDASDLDARDADVVAAGGDRQKELAPA